MLAPFEVLLFRVAVTLVFFGALQVIELAAPSKQDTTMTTLCIGDVVMSKDCMGICFHGSNMKQRVWEDYIDLRRARGPAK